MLDPDSPGGQGEAAPDPDADAAVTMRRSDLLLLRQAARGRWAVPDRIKAEAIFQATLLLTRSEDERVRVAAARTLAAFDKIDQADDRLDLERARLEAARPADASEDDYVIDLSADDPAQPLDGPPA